MKTEGFMNTMFIGVMFISVLVMAFFVFLDEMYLPSSFNQIMWVRKILEECQVGCSHIVCFFVLQELDFADVCACQSARMSLSVFRRWLASS